MRRKLKQLTSAQTMHGFAFIGAEWVGARWVWGEGWKLPDGRCGPQGKWIDSIAGATHTLDPVTEFSPERNNYLVSIVNTFPSHAYTRKVEGKIIVFTNRDGKLPSPDKADDEELGQNNDFGKLFNALYSKVGQPARGIFVIPIIDSAMEQHIALTVIDIESQQILYIDSKYQPAKAMSRKVEKKFKAHEFFKDYKFKKIITDRQSFADEVTCGYQVLTLSKIVLDILIKRRGNINAITPQLIRQKINQLSESPVSHAQKILQDSQHSIMFKRAYDMPTGIERENYENITTMLSAVFEFWNKSSNILASAWHDTYSHNSTLINAVSFLPKFFCEFLPKSVELGSQFLRDKLMTVNRNNPLKRAGTSFALLSLYCLKKLAQYTRTLLLRPLSSPLKSLKAAKGWRENMIRKYGFKGNFAGSIAVVGSALITVVGWTAVILASLGTTIPAVAAALGTVSAGITTSALATGTAISTTTGTIATASAVGGSAAIATGIYIQNQKNKKSASVTTLDSADDDDWQVFDPDGTSVETSSSKPIEENTAGAETRIEGMPSVSKNSSSLFGSCATETRKPEDTLRVFSRPSSPVH